MGSTHRFVAAPARAAATRASASRSVSPWLTWLDAFAFAAASPSSTRASSSSASASLPQLSLLLEPPRSSSSPVARVASRAGTSSSSLASSEEASPSPSSSPKSNIASFTSPVRCTAYRREAAAAAAVTTRVPRASRTASRAVGGVARGASPPRLGALAFGEVSTRIRDAHVRLARRSRRTRWRRTRPARGAPRLTGMSTRFGS